MITRADWILTKAATPRHKRQEGSCLMVQPYEEHSKASAINVGADVCIYVSKKHLRLRRQPCSLDCHGGAMRTYHCALENTTDFSFKYTCIWSY